MVYELDKIDAMRFDKKETITLYIYDIDIWHTEQEIQEHIYFTQKKIETYVNYILQGDAAQYFNLSIDNYYSYVIEFIAEKMKVSKSYLTFLHEIAAHIHQSYGETITLNLTKFKVS